MCKLRLSSTLAGITFLSLYLAGCQRAADLPAKVGSEGESLAQAALEQILEAVERGNEDKVWEALSSKSQSRIKEDIAEDIAAGRMPARGKDEKAKAVEVLRALIGSKAKIKEVRGDRGAVMIMVVLANGTTRELVMVVSEGGAWKLHLFAA
jgi:hypothetical protein